MFSKQDQQDFLANYWQQKPLLMRAYIPDFVDPIDANVLAGLACEDFVESRLISKLADSHKWHLQHGPFTEAVFQQLPDSNWTLLVQAVDQWHEETAALLSCFDFLPSWRIDDVMVSFATDNAGVGPHYDHYDVFLVQGAGHRKWRLGGKCNADSKLLGASANSALPVLEEFVSEQEFVLQPGDVLYIPPQYAHYGSSVGESLCYSIGFRSPSQAEQLQGFTDEIIAGLAEHNRYVDPNPIAEVAPGEILTSALDQAQHKLVELVGDKRAFQSWFGKYVTEPKNPETIGSLQQPSGLLNIVAQGLQTIHNPGSRFAYIQRANEVLLFVDGENYTLPSRRLGQVKKLCAEKSFSSNDMEQFGASKDFRAVIVELLSRGSLLAQ